MQLTNLCRFTAPAAIIVSAQIEMTLTTLRKALRVIFLFKFYCPLPKKCFEIGMTELQQQQQQQHFIASFCSTEMQGYISCHFRPFTVKVKKNINCHITMVT